MANSIDVVSGEKLPNGDVSQFMTQMNKELSSIKEKGTTEGLTIKDKAHFLAVAKNLTSAIEYYTKLWGAELVKEVEPGVGFDFPDLGQTVTVKNGGNNSKISPDIFDELSLEQIKAVATVSEKALKDYDNVRVFVSGSTKPIEKDWSSYLIEKYKVITGQKANSVMYKSLI